MYIVLETLVIFQCQGHSHGGGGHSHGGGDKKAETANGTAKPEVVTMRESESLVMPNCDEETEADNDDVIIEFDEKRQCMYTFRSLPPFVVLPVG